MAAALYEDRVTAIADAAAATSLALWAAFKEGAYTYAEFSDLSADIISQSMAKGVTVAQLTFAGYLKAGLGYIPEQAPPPPPEDNRGKLRKALDSIFGEDPANLSTEAIEKAEIQLERLATSEVKTASGRGFYNALWVSEDVDFYTRGLERGHCELCFWLWKEGYEYPTSTYFYMHPGCVCHPVPVISTNRKG